MGNIAMTFISGEYRVMLLSTHLPVRQVHTKIRKDNLLKKFTLAGSLLDRLEPDGKIEVLALNPHAGEGGILGTEERIIKEAIDASGDCRIKGPHPTDAFFRHWRGGGLVLAMFHDQGLIPFKMRAKNRGVNVSWGLPFVRTSPDHGTAFDIAGKGIADPSSMIEAIKLACELSS